MSDFPLELTVGGVSADELIRRLVGAGVQFNENAQTLFGHRLFAPSSTSATVALVKVAPAELGLKGEYSYHDVLRRGAGRGLKLCPLSLGAFLRLEYLEQPPGPYLTIASPELGGGENDPTGFYIRNNEGALWLRGYRALGECEWPAENEFVFLK